MFFYYKNIKKNLKESFFFLLRLLYFFQKPSKISFPDCLFVPSPSLLFDSCGFWRKKGGGGRGEDVEKAKKRYGMEELTRLSWKGGGVGGEDVEVAKKRSKQD